MMKECPYTASSRDALENTPPSALEISRRRGFCTPRPSRLPSGFALGQSLGPRGAKSPPSGNLSGLGGCIFRYIPPLVSVRTHSFIIIREVLILTLSIFSMGVFLDIPWKQRWHIEWNDLQRSHYPIHSLLPRECTRKYIPRDSISWYTPNREYQEHIITQNTFIMLQQWCRYAQCRHL